MNATKNKQQNRFDFSNSTIDIALVGALAVLALVGGCVWQLIVSIVVGGGGVRMAINN